MKKLGGYFVLRKQGLTEKLRGKCLEVSGKLRTFAFDGSNDRAPAFGLTRTTIFMRGCYARCHLSIGNGHRFTSDTPY